MKLEIDTNSERVAIFYQKRVETRKTMREKTTVNKLFMLVVVFFYMGAKKERVIRNQIEQYLLI